MLRSVAREPKAIDGTLSVMVGGDETVSTVRDVLGVMGSSVVHVGPIGAGNTTKLANQVVVALNIAAAAEALVLARLAVSSRSRSSPPSAGARGQRRPRGEGADDARPELRPGFRIELHAKDLANALDAAEEVDAPLPLTRSVLEMMRSLQESGTRREDHRGSSSSTRAWLTPGSSGARHDHDAPHRRRHPAASERAARRRDPAGSGRQSLRGRLPVLYEAGFRCLEFTLTTEGALDAVAEVPTPFPTTWSSGWARCGRTAQVDDAITAGAEFLVSQVFRQPSSRPPATAPCRSSPGP